MAFITKITDYIIDNYDLTKDTLTVIFPNKRAALSLRKELSLRIHKNIWFPRILSIQEAMSSWSGIQLIDNVDIIYELIRIMSNFLDVSTRSNIFGLASQIVKDFDEIDQYAVNADDLFSYLKAAKEAESWSPDSDKLSEVESAYINFFASLNSYYKRLREELLKNSYGYYGLITRKLYDLSNAELEDVVGNNKIIFAGFNAMTLTEESLITRLVESQKAVLLWDLDKYYLEDEKQEAGLFARQFFSKHKNLKPDKIADNFNDKQINIIGVSGSTVQANALQLQLTHSHNDNDLSNEVVVLSDETLLLPVLNSITDKFTDISVTMGYPYSKTIVNQFILDLFSFQKNIDKDNNIYFWSLKKLLETEFVKVIFNAEELNSFTKSIITFLKESNYYISKKELDAYITSKRVLDFVKIIAHKWESSNSCITEIKSLLFLINQYISNLSNNFIKNQISVAGRIINKIERLLNKYNVIIQISDIEALYKNSALEMSIKLENDKSNDSDSSLQIMGLLETRNLDFDTVHILSVNEGILPQSKTANSLIPFDLRLSYGLPIYTNKQAVYAYHFYRLIQNAKTINLYYNTLADGMGEGEQSRFILQIINELPFKGENITINEITYKAPSPKINEVNDLSIVKTDELLEKIITKLSGINKYGAKKGLSPTSISCYLKCPLQFYLKYIENVTDNTAEELIPVNIIGNIIHSTFEFLYAKFDKGIINIDYYNKIIKDHLDEAFKDALNENNFKKGLPETGFNYLTQIMINEIVNSFINYERQFICNGNELSIIALEENLSHSFDIDGVEVNLTGFADRIDKVNEKIRIIDYKSGSVKDDDVVIKSSSEQISDLSNKSLQLCIYKYLYAKNNPDVDIKDIEPGIYGLLKVSNPFFPLVNYSDSFNDDNFIKTCDLMFENVIREILDKETPFKQTNDVKDCNNCDFISICKRNPRKFTK